MLAYPTAPGSVSVSVWLEEVVTSARWARKGQAELLCDVLCCALKSLCPGTYVRLFFLHRAYWGFSPTRAWTRSEHMVETGGAKMMPTS